MTPVPLSETQNGLLDESEMPQEFTRFESVIWATPDWSLTRFVTMKESLAFVLLAFSVVLNGCMSSPKSVHAGGTARKSTITVEGTVCEIHRVLLQRMALPVGYGGPDQTEYDFRFAEVRKTSFPHADENVSLGCVRRRSDPKILEVLQCPECRRTMYEWLAAHKDSIDQKRANQALLPTPTSVTDRADARSAPDAGAADL